MRRRDVEVTDPDDAGDTGEVKATEIRTSAPDSSRTVLVLGAVALVLVLTAGFVVGRRGLQPDEHPQPIPRERLDSRLFREGAQSRTGGGPGIYVLSGQDRTPRLFRVGDIEVPAGSSPEHAAKALLEALFAWAPPNDRGGNARLRSLVPSGTTLHGVRLADDVLTVDLADVTIEGAGQAQALAQIVYTATEIEAVRHVRFTIDGKQVAVPLPGGNTSPGALLNRDDFAPYRPDPEEPAPEEGAPVPGFGVLPAGPQTTGSLAVDQAPPRTHGATGAGGSGAPVTTSTSVPLAPIEIDQGAAAGDLAPAINAELHPAGTIAGRPAG